MPDNPLTESRATDSKGTGTDNRLLRLNVEKYVDNYKHVIYNPDYRLQEGSPTNWMQVFYHDGTKIDVNVYSFDENASPRDTRDHIANGSLGMGGRFFPRSLNQYTTPRLWGERQKAIEKATRFTNILMAQSLEALLPVLAIGMPVARLPIPGARPPPVRLTPGTPKTLAEMGKFVTQILKRNRVLQRLVKAHKKGATKTDLDNILTEFAYETGITKEIVSDGVVQAGTKSPGNFASIQLKVGKLLIEESVIKNPRQYLQEVTHELSFYYTKKTGSNPSLLGIRASKYLEMLIENLGVWSPK
jgi:hypothetical protein